MSVTLLLPSSGTVRQREVRKRYWTQASRSINRLRRAQARKEAKGSTCKISQWLRTWRAIQNETENSYVLEVKRKRVRYLALSLSSV